MAWVKSELRFDRVSALRCVARSRGSSRRALLPLLLAQQLVLHHARP